MANDAAALMRRTKALRKREWRRGWGGRARA